MRFIKAKIKNYDKELVLFTSFLTKDLELPFIHRIFMYKDLFKTNYHIDSFSCLDAEELGETNEKDYIDCFIELSKKAGFPEEEIDIDWIKKDLNKKREHELKIIKGEVG